MNLEVDGVVHRIHEKSGLHGGHYWSCCNDRFWWRDSGYPQFHLDGELGVAASATTKPVNCVMCLGDRC